MQCHIMHADAGFSEYTIQMIHRSVIDHIVLYCFLLTDIDECSDDTHGCTFNCTNTNGSYVCSCDAGYQLNEDGLQCDGMASFNVVYFKKAVYI